MTLKLQQETKILNLHPLNTYSKFKESNTDENIEAERAIRKLMGHKTHALSPINGPIQSKEIRKKIQRLNSSKQIIELLNASFNADITVYTSAIKQCGKLKDVLSCEKIMQMIQKRNLIPCIYCYNILFHAFNQNNKPNLCFDHFNQMIKIHKIIPDAVTLTTLLGGCTKHGNIERAEIIFKLFTKYNVPPNEMSYVELIQTYGQAGNFHKCQQLYDEMLSKKITMTVSVKTALMHAYIKSNKIDIALKLKRQFESEGIKMNEICYAPFVSFYLRPIEHFNPKKSIKLIKECKTKNNLKYMSSKMINIKFIAYRKLMEIECDRDKRLKYFELIKAQPNYRKRNKLNEWDIECAKNVFDSYLIYYNNDYNNEEVIKCFDNLCKHGGFWSVDGMTKNWILDFHGHNYETAKFALHYLFMRKTDELVSEMGYEWTIICGKQQGSDPKSKGLTKGMKQFVIDTLASCFQIESETDPRNGGRVVLNSETVKRHIYSTNNKAIEMDLGVQNEERDHKTRVEYMKMSQADLRTLCIEKGLKRAGNKKELTDRLLDPSNPIHKDRRKSK